MKRTPLKRTKGLNPVSKKRRREAPVRRELVKAQLDLIPFCEASLLGVGCDFTAVDVHEIIPRGRKPGAHLIPDLYTSLCRNCHSWLTAHPDFATRHGFMLTATASELDIMLARGIRDKYDCPLPATLRHTCEKDHNDN